MGQKKILLSGVASKLKIYEESSAELSALNVNASQAYMNKIFQSKVLCKFAYKY